MLEYQYSIWQTYPKEIEVVLIDDGSPLGLRAEEIVAKFPKLTCAFRLYRIMIDVQWNEGAARNIGARFATRQWVALVDIDHIVPLATLEELMRTSLDAETVYSFTRLEHFSRKLNNPHKESRMMTRDLYWKVGGYDESLSGHYSFYCTDWRERLDVHPKMELPLPLERVDRTVVPDANTVGLIRKEGRDEAFFKDAREWKRMNNVPIELFKFPWKLVMEQG